MTLPTFCRRPAAMLTVAASLLTAVTAMGTAPVALAVEIEQAVAPDGPVTYDFHDLGPLAGGTASFALGLSSESTAVGTSRTGTSFRPQVAVRWKDGQVENLGSLPGSTFSRAFEVNNRGQAVGEAFTAPPEVSRAVLWEPDGTMRDLGTLGGPSAVANDIDERGRAFGVRSRTSGPSIATVWGDAGAEALPGLDRQATGASRANAVSRSGEAVGNAPSRLADGSSVGQAVRWMPRGEAVLGSDRGGPRLHLGTFHLDSAAARSPELTDSPPVA